MLRQVVVVAFLMLGGALGGPATYPPSPNPSYAPQEQADQPIYTPDGGPSASGFLQVSPVAAGGPSPSPPAPHDMQPYAHEGFADSYGAYSGYEPGYGVQTGYEGYLLPSAPGNAYNSLSVPSEEGPISYLWSLLPYTATVVSVVVHVAKFVLGASVVLLAGAAIVLGICTFTPLCSVQFPGFDGLHLKEEVRSLVTPDNLSAATKFVRQAIDKYQQMQKTGGRRR